MKPQRKLGLFFVDYGLGSRVHGNAFFLLLAIGYWLLAIGYWSLVFGL